MNGSALLALAAGSAAQNPVPQAPTPAERAQMMEAMKRNNAMPDGTGTSAFPAKKEVDPRLPDHVVYRPADLGTAGKGRLGAVGWAIAGVRRTARARGCT